MTRLILDTSTITRWTGPPVGIVRVEHELVQHALRRRPDVVLSFYDPRTASLRALAPRWRDLLTGLDGGIDTIGVDYRRHRPAWRNLLPSRYPLVMALERHRLTGPAATAPVAAAVQRVLLGRDAYRQPFGGPGGRRTAAVPYNAALGPALSLGPDDTVLSAGSDWLHKGAALVALQRARGFRLAVLCYDLLPWSHPEFFQGAASEPFVAYWRAILPVAARVLCNSACVAGDIARFAAAHGLAAPTPALVPLGHAPKAGLPMPPLPAPLQAGRFALFVSTIEPRKGHAVLLAAWRKLTAAGVPQRHGFRLVFVGRAGWMVDDVLAALREDGVAVGGSVLHLTGIDDATLARLYRDAAFCVYASRYEGFGLPIIEAFAQGKAVLASTGGALPETVGGLSPCLDPLDVDAWASHLADWIEHPEAVAAWEARIAADFRYATWADAAEGIMRTAMADG